MRWFWIDRFLAFHRGSHAVAVKTISLSDHEIADHFPAYPLMPSSLIVEGLAQAGGLLVSDCRGFRDRVVLAKVSRAVFHRVARPGETLTYTVHLESLQPDGAMVRGESRLGEHLQAEAELYFGFLEDRALPRDLFEPADLLRMLRVFAMYDVGQDEQGRPLDIPPRLLAAERSQNQMPAV